MSRLNSIEQAMRRLAIAATVPVVTVALGTLVASASSSTGPLESSRPVCAAHLWLRPENRNRASSQVLVPMAPREVLLCRYYGSTNRSDTPKGPFGTLAGDRLVRPAAPTRSLAREFDDLQPLPDHPVHCRRDDGAALYALFRYDHQREVPVKVGFSGCAVVTNGRMDDAFFLSNHLARRLGRLTAAVQLEP
jgi:hypothetical protein